MPLNPHQKEEIFEALKKNTPEELHSALLDAALNNEEFPIEEKDFSMLCAVYISQKSPKVTEPLKVAISEFYKEKIADMLTKILQEPFDAEKWRTSFLSFLATRLKLEIKNEPLVQLTIKDGKVYWRIIKGQDVVYDRPREKNYSFDFDKVNKILMTWKQFRIFKDSGKRGSSIAITKARFVISFPDLGPVIAGSIWDELKGKNILDRNDRLSNFWRFAELLPLNGARDYKRISEVLHQISTSPAYAEQIAVIPGASIYRPERSPKIWWSTARITNCEPKSEVNKVQKWDVSIFRDLSLHATSGDDLDHDHIPSTAFLKKMQEESTSKTDEDYKNWSCIAIPETLHKQGLSHGEHAQTQQKKIASPFIDEVKSYLDILELKWRDTPVTDDTYLEALGAFRYLFRCQLSRKHGEMGHRFFQENVLSIQTLDTMFYERLERFMEKKEGSVNALSSS